MNCRLSVSMPSLETEEGYPYLAWAKDAGFQAVECELAHPDDDGVRRNVRKGLDACGLAISGIRTGISYTLEGLCLSSPDPAVAEAAVERLIGINRFVAGYPGALNLIGMMQGRIARPEDYPAARSRVVAGLRRVCASAGALGVRVSLEAINHLIINYHNTLEETLGVIDEVGSPSLGLLADTFHMNIEEKNMVASVLKAGKRINHVHVADSNRWAPGRGHIDFGAFFEALDRTGYEGWITVEADPKPDFRTMACEAYAFVGRYMR